MTVASDAPLLDAPLLDESLLDESALDGTAVDILLSDEAPTPLSPGLVTLMEAVAVLRAQDPTAMVGAHAVAEAAVLLGEVEKLKAVVLGRVADVDTRGLHELVGAPSTRAWLGGLQVGVDRSTVALARTLRRHPAVDAAVRSGSLSLPGAERIAQALGKLRRFVDRPDGLIDGQDAAEVLPAVIVDGVVMLAGQARGGWPGGTAVDEEGTATDLDPMQAALIASLQEVADRPVSEVARLEAAFVLLAGQLEPAQLRPALGMLVDALLPVQLEQRAQDAARRAQLRLELQEDKTSYRISGVLDLECGELLRAALAAAQATDPDNPADTAAYAAARQAERAGEAEPVQGEPRDGKPVAGDLDGPEVRSPARRAHDGFKLVLRALLDGGALGKRGKVAPHVTVTVSLDAVKGKPGAMPAVTGAGTAIPASLLRCWAYDSRLSRLVLSLGRRVIEASHHERTLKPVERGARDVNWGGQCEAAGCNPPAGTIIIPHHVTAWAACGTTSLADTVGLCKSSHHDIHEGGKTIRLKDGRYLSESGFVAGPVLC